jgi:hypothetical protein
LATKTHRKKDTSCQKTKKKKEKKEKKRKRKAAMTFLPLCSKPVLALTSRNRYTGIKPPVRGRATRKTEGETKRKKMPGKLNPRNTGQVPCLFGGYL